MIPTNYNNKSCRLLLKYDWRVSLANCIQTVAFVSKSTLTIRLTAAVSLIQIVALILVLLINDIRLVRKPAQGRVGIIPWTLDALVVVALGILETLRLQVDWTQGCSIADPRTHIETCLLAIGGLNTGADS